MSFADIEDTWRSPHNRSTAAEIESHKMKLNHDLHRRRRGFLLFIVPVLAALLYLTGRVIVHLVWPDPTLDRIDFAREWSFLLVLALPWAGALYMVWQHGRHRIDHKSYERSISDTVRALLDENRLARARLKVAALLHGVFLLILPLVVYQLRATGKAGDEILLPAFVLWPLIAAGIGLAILYNYRRKLIPQKRELETLLRSYQQQ